MGRSRFLPQAGWGSRLTWDLVSSDQTPRRQLHATESKAQQIHGKAGEADGSHPAARQGVSAAVRSPSHFLTPRGPEQT